MSTSALLLLDLVAAACTAAAWAAAALLALRPPGGRSRPLLLASMASAVVLLGVQGLACALLSARGWAFVQEKVLLVLPLQVVCAALAIWLSATLLLPRGGKAEHDPVRSRIRAGTSLIVAAAAAVAGIVARTVVGYPASPLSIAVLVLLVALTGWLACSLLSAGRRRATAGAAMLLCLVVVSSAGYAWLTDVAQPAALTSHEHLAGSATDSSGSGVNAAASVSVDSLRTPPDAPGTVRRFELTAQHQTLAATSGAEVDAWTFGSVPGPELRVTVGDVVDVILYNKDIAEGVTLHWHGYDVPNGEDGVAGATQESVQPGESFSYRFVADEAGSYWYHTHQMSAEGIRRGLYGALIVEPREGIQQDVDLVVPVHTYGSAVWLAADDTPRTEEVEPGRTVRLRLINTDQLPRRLRLTGTEFFVAAVDGRDLVGSTALRDRAVRLPAGGRIDLTFTVPQGGVLLSTDSTSQVSLGIGPPRSHPLDLVVDRAAADVDLLAYGTRDVVLPTGMRGETMVLDQLPRFLRGVPTNAFTVNGAVTPHIDSIEVSEGDVIRLTVVNRGRDTHPMHIHGHHVLVLSRDGVSSTGSALWLDTFDVQPGEVWQVMLVADNPGIWMDHCHNLEHADQGMMMALTYTGVFTPYDHSHITG